MGIEERTLSLYGYIGYYVSWGNWLNLKFEWVHRKFSLISNKEFQGQRPLVPSYL